MRKKDPRKEEAIYQAVLSICREKGLHGITMAEIAKVAGIASGTLYIYFKSKEDLIQEMHQDLLIRRAQSIRDEVDVKPPFEKAFENYWFSYLEYLLEHTDELIFLKHYNLLYPVDYKESRHSTHVEPLNSIIRKGMKSGKIEKGPISIKTAMIVYSLEELVFAHSNGALVLDQSGIAEAFRMATYSLSTTE